MLVGRVEAAKALDLPSVIQLCRYFNTLDVTGRLAQIKLPTCVVVGEQDMRMEK